MIDVRKTAELSKLCISESEIPAYEKQMSEIVAMASVLSEVVTDNCRSSAQTAPMSEDIQSDQTLSRDELMRNAPEQSEGFFCVPKTVE